MAITSEMIEKQSAAKQKLIAAKARASGVTLAKEQMKNLLFNYYEDLVQSALDNISQREEVSAQDEALQEADKENDSLRLKTNGSNNSSRKKTAQKE